MGALSIQGGAATYSNPLITSAGFETETGKALGLFPSKGASGEPAKDTLTLGSDAQSASLYQALSYHAQMERISLVALFQQAAAAGEDTTSAASDSTGKSASTANQMMFSFYAESREEEMVLFRDKTSSAADGMTTSQRETYIEASRKISGRFTVSFDLSGSALQGFASAVKDLGSKEEVTADKLLTLLNDALGKSDDTTNQVFEWLRGFMSGLSGSDDQLSSFIDSIYNSGILGNAASGGGASQSGSAATAQQTQGMQLHFEFDVQFQSEETVQYQEVQVKQSDPITFDLDGDGIELSSYRNGANFDITGSGQQARTAFVTGGDAFLAIDRNGNGKIDSGKELFGDQNGAKNGYAELAKLDSNGDGVINAKDKDFDSLKLFRDNGDGKTDAGELVSLAEAGISEIDLHFKNVNQKAAGGNLVSQVGTYRRTNGQLGKTADAILNYIA